MVVRYEIRRGGSSRRLLITTTLLEGAVDFAARAARSCFVRESLTYDRVSAAETNDITHVNTAQYLARIEGRIEFPST